MNKLLTYKSWPDVPEHLKTKTALKQDGLQPGGEPVAKVYQRLNNKWIDLYDVNAATPRKNPTGKQLQAIEKARKAKELKRTCKKCGDILLSPKDLIDGYCYYCNLALYVDKEKKKAKELFSSWLLNKDDYIILDTETTGLDEQSEIIELSILDLHGRTLLDTLIKPTQPIPEYVTGIHGITNEMVSDAPTFAEIHEEFMGIVKDKILLIYNDDFDIRLIYQTCKKYGLKFFRNHIKSECVMTAYAEYFGDFDFGDEIFIWKKLSFAVETEGIEILQNHRALDDCKLVLELIKVVAMK